MSAAVSFSTACPQLRHKHSISAELRAYLDPNNSTLAVAMSTIEALLESKDAEIKAKDDTIKAKDDTIKAKDDMIKDLTKANDDTIKAKDDTIKALTKAKDDTIKAKDDMIKAKDDTVKKMEESSKQMINLKDTIINDRNDRLAYLNMRHLEDMSAVHVRGMLEYCEKRFMRGPVTSHLSRFDLWKNYLHQDPLLLKKLQQNCKIQNVGEVADVIERIYRARNNDIHNMNSLKIQLDENAYLKRDVRILKEIMDHFGFTWVSTNSSSGS